MFTLKMLFVFAAAGLILAGGVASEESVKGQLDNEVYGENSRPGSPRKPRQNVFGFLQQLSGNPFLNGDGNGNNQVFGNEGFGNNRPSRQPQNDNSIFFDDDNQFNDFVMPNRPNRQFSRQGGVPARFQNNNNNFNNNQLVRTTQRPSRRTTVAIPGMGTTQSACEDACRTTNQYNPVCGDNNVTYFNLERLKCAQKCGRNVRIQVNRACARF